MYCYDCASDGRHVPGSAICSDCGVAACNDHARVTTVTVRQPVGLGSPILQGGRKVTCAACAGTRRLAA